MDSAPDQPRSPRSNALTDLAAAREAAVARGAVDLEEHEDVLEAPSASVSSGVLATFPIVGVAIFVVGVATSSVLGAIGAAVGVTVAVTALVMLFRRTGPTGRLGLGVLAGSLAFVVGVALGIQSYDERYFGVPAEREFWDAVSLVGFLLVVTGLLVAVASLVGVLVSATVRLLRRS